MVAAIQGMNASSSISIIPPGPGGVKDYASLVGAALEAPLVELTPQTPIPGLPFSVTAGAREIRRSIVWRDRITNLAILGIVMVGGYSTLWSGNLTWGSGADWAAAILAGAGLQFGFGTALSDLLAQVKK